VRCVACLAQEGCPRLQQICRCRAVWVVAIAAVLVYRLVAMHKGPTLFHMAGVASLHYRVALHEAGACGAVGVVAIRARHLAFKHGVVRGLVDLVALLLVASKAGFALGALVTHGVLGLVHGMAGRTGDIAGLVDAAFPVRALAVLGVAALAGAIAGIGR